MTAERVPEHLTAAWDLALSSPQHWCACGEYRVQHAGDLCPVCADEIRQAS